MAIKDTIYEGSFIDGFKRSQYKENFSYEGLQELFKYLDDLSDGMGEDIEFDIVAIAGEYSEVEEDDLDQYGEVIAELDNGSYLVNDY